MTTFKNRNGIFLIEGNFYGTIEEALEFVERWNHINKGDRAIQEIEFTNGMRLFLPPAEKISLQKL